MFAPASHEERAFARYHFHIDDPKYGLDDHGTVLAHIAEAKSQAIEMVGQVARETSDFWDRGELKMTIADARGLTLFTLQVVGNDAPSMRLRAAMG